MEEHIIYENPLPQLRSRQSMFPNVVELADGTLLCAHAIGEAFESVDLATHVSRSTDGGRTWSEPRRAIEKKPQDLPPLSDCGKLTVLPDGELLLFGYAYLRSDPELPMGNPETGGLLEDRVFLCRSRDGGESFGEMQLIDTAWGPHAEASGPLILLSDGTLAAPTTGFAHWDGVERGRRCGRLLYSEDGGKSWKNDRICMAFPRDEVLCFEQRLTKLQSGTLVDVAWNENTATGKRLCNHVTLSRDNGVTWSEPFPTGVMGQAASLCHLGGERALLISSLRRDAAKPGIWGYVMDFSGDTPTVDEGTLLWQPPLPPVADGHMAEVFSFLKFGQPSAILLSDGDLLLSFWARIDGLYKTFACRIRL